MSGVTKFPDLSSRRRTVLAKPPNGVSDDGESSWADLTTISNAPPESTRTLETALGHRIRVLRHDRDLSVAELGQAAGISLGMVSKIENGQISPSLSTISAIAAALNVPLSSLFATFEEKRDCSYVKSGQGVIIDRGGTKVGHIYEILGASLGGDIAIEPYLIRLKDDAESYAGFHHSGTEFIYMLTGEVIYRHSNHDYHLKPGDSLMFDSAGLHGPVKMIGSPIMYISIIIYSRKKD